MGGANSKLFLQESVKKEKTPIILTYVKDTLDAIKSGGDISNLKTAVQKAQDALNTAESNKVNDTAARDAKITEATKKLLELQTKLNELYKIHKQLRDTEYKSWSTTPPTDQMKVAMVIAENMSKHINNSITDIKDITNNSAKKILTDIKTELEISKTVTTAPSDLAEQILEILFRPGGSILNLKTIITNFKTPAFDIKNIDKKLIEYIPPDRITPIIDELLGLMQNIPNPAEQDIANKTETLRIAQENLKKAKSSEKLPQLIKNLDNISWTIPELEPLKLKAKALEASGPKTTGAPAAAAATAPVAPAPIVSSGKFVDIMKIINDSTVDESIKTQVKTLWNNRRTDSQWSGKLRTLISNSFPTRLSEFFTNNKPPKLDDVLKGGARTSRRNRKTPERQSYRRPRSRGNSTRKNHRPRKGE